MDPLTILALVAAVAFLIVLVRSQTSKNKSSDKPLGFTESELAALSSKKDKKKEKKQTPKSDAKPAPVVSRRLKGVDGAADYDSDEQMLSFLNNKITLENKRGGNSEDNEKVEKSKPKNSVKEPAEKPAAGFTEVVDKKKKKDSDEAPEEKKKEEVPEEKKKPKPFYKSEAEAQKKEAEARKAERDAREKAFKETGVRPPRAPRPKKEGEAETAEASDEKRERKPRPAGDANGRPKREFTPIQPAYTEPFEEWAINDLLDQITASPVEKQSRASKSAKSAPKAEAVAVEEVAQE